MCYICQSYQNNIYGAKYLSCPLTPGASCRCDLHHPASWEQEGLLWPARLHHPGLGSPLCRPLQPDLPHRVPAEPVITHTNHDYHMMIVVNEAWLWCLDAVCGPAEVILHTFRTLWWWSTAVCNGGWTPYRDADDEHWPFIRGYDVTNEQKMGWRLCCQAACLSQLSAVKGLVHTFVIFFYNNIGETWWRSCWNKLIKKFSGYRSSL